MSWSSWSVRLWVLAFAGALNLVATGCGSSMPTVRGVADRDFAGHKKAVRSVDILPADLQVWTAPGADDTPDSIRGRLEGTATGQASAQLASKGYQVNAELEWDGLYTGHDGRRYRGMLAEEVVTTNYALSSYGRAVAASSDQLLVPYLPHRLGARTGSDATLYIGGWAYVGKKKSSTGAKVAKGLLIGLLIAAVVIIVIAAAKEGGGGIGNAANGAGKAAAGAAKGAARVASGMARAVGRVGFELARGAVQLSGDVLQAMAEADYRGHTHTHISISGSGRPNYYQERDTPRRGTSRMYVEMTLIDNRSGETLWHARQQFSAHGDSSDDVNAVIARMLASLPAGG